MDEQKVLFHNRSLDPQPAVEVDATELEKSLRRPRSLFSYLLSFVTTALTLLALVPLFSVVYMLFVRGGHKLTVACFTQLPPAAFEEGGGFGNAILGTLVMVGISALIAVPVGVLAAVFLAEIGPNTRLAQVVRFAAKLLSGFPSILAGVFAYGAVVMLTGGFSAIAGGIALSLLMVPIVILTAEDSIRRVPARMREAAIGMGATPTQTICRVLLPTAMPGILTGVMLGIARAAGETAPLLFTALFSNYWLINGMKPLMAHPAATLSGALTQPAASLAVLIYNFSSSPFENQQEMAWAAALVLVLLVLATNLIGQSFSKRNVTD
jgi:phosphate transport system permease protein